MDGPEMYFMRQTMLQQECIFKEQVRELHRLYEKQKLLMTEVKRGMLKFPNSSSCHPPTPGTRDFLDPLSRQEGLTRKSSPVVGGECTSFSRDNTPAHSRARRRRTLDLEQLPDDNDQDIEYVRENSQHPGTCEKREPPQAISFSLNKTWEENCTLEPSSSRQHWVEAACKPPRPTLEEMALFPIPSTSGGEPVKDQPKPLFESERGKNGILGWHGSGKKCDQEAYWGQQVAQLPHWLLQSCRGPPDKRAIPGTSQGYDSTKRDPWKTPSSKECHAIGQEASEGVDVFLRSMPGYEQHGRRFSHGSSANYPPLNMSEIACLQMNSLGQTVLVPADVNSRSDRGMLWSQTKGDHAWLHQAPLAYSYFTQEASTPLVSIRKNGFVVDASRIYADSLRSCWYSGSSFKPPVPTFDNKENPPKFFYDGCSVNGSGAVTDKHKGSSDGSARPHVSDAETGVGFRQVDEQYSSPQVEDAKSKPMEASLTQLVCQEETWKVGDSTGSVPAIENDLKSAFQSADGSANVQIGTLGPSCTDSSRNAADISTDSAVVDLEVIRVGAVDGFSASTGGTESSRATECIGDSDCMGVNDTASAATILLSFAPEKSSIVTASNGKALQESSLLSDVKLLKSVAIMLKGGGAKATKKLVAAKAFRRGEAAAGKGLLRSLNSGLEMRQEERKSARRESVHSDGNDKKIKDGASKKGAQTYSQSWIWGDVTRRKRMQRQRHHAFRQPQQVQA